MALLLEVDAIGLVRTARSGGAEGAALAQYVNDRPYAASSLLAVALGKAFSSARRGVSKERPELVDTALPLEVHVPALSCRGGVEMAQRFFAPLGWQVAVVATVFVNETLWYLFVARALSLPRARDGYLRLKSTLNRVFGALLAALGIQVALA